MEKYLRTALFIFVLAVLMLSPGFTQVAMAQSTGACGDSRGTENFGFTFPNGNQAHWTVNGENFVSQDTLDQVDVILDKLNEDNIAQTMILIIPSEQVAVGPNCAGDFFEYMELGNYEGPRADNGFAWVIAYNQQSDSVALYYAPGPSLNSLYASDLKPMKRSGSDIYESTHSLDQVLLQTITAFDSYARQQYEPYHEPVSQTNELPQPVSSTGSGFSFLGCLFVGFLLVCLVIFLVMVVRFGRGSPRTTVRRYPPSSNSPASTTHSVRTYRAPATKPAPKRSGSKGRGPTRVG